MQPNRIWEQVKGDVTIRNNTFRIKGVKRILKEDLCRVTVEDRKDCVLYCKYVQEEDFIEEDKR